MIRPTKQTRLGDLLVERGAITSEQLEFAIAEQHLRRQLAQDRGRTIVGAIALGEILCEMGFINHKTLNKTLRKQQRLRKAAMTLALLAPLMAPFHAFAVKTTNSNETNNSQTQTLDQDKTDGATTTVEQTRSVTLSWSAPDSRVNEQLINSSDIVAYKIIYKANNENQYHSKTVSNDNSHLLILDNLHEGDYEINIAAIDSQGLESDFSTQYVHIDVPPPPTVANTLELQWEVPTARVNDEQLASQDISGYAIRYRAVDADSYQTTRIDDPDITSLTLNHLAPGDYEIDIATIDRNGLQSDWLRRLATVAESTSTLDEEQLLTGDNTGSSSESSSESSGLGATENFGNTGIDNSPSDQTAYTDNTTTSPTTGAVSDSSTTTTTIVQGSIQLSWHIPDSRENGEDLPLYEIGGYEILYKRQGEPLFYSEIITDAQITGYQLQNLQSGDYEIMLASYDNDGDYSSYSTLHVHID